MTRTRVIVLIFSLLEVVGIVAAIVFVHHVLDLARRTSSLNNLKQMGIVFKMYSGEDPEHQYPAPTPRSAVPTPDLARLYPEYLTELSVLLVPSWHSGYEPFEQAAQRWPAHLDQAEAIVATNHVYFGYAFSTEAELNALLDAIPQLAKTYPKPLERPGAPPLLPLGEAELLAEGTSPKIDPSKAVVLFENPRINGGRESIINVLYLNGQSRMVPREEFFPHAHFDKLPPDPVDSFWKSIFN